MSATTTGAGAAIARDAVTCFTEGFANGKIVHLLCAWCGQRAMRVGPTLGKKLLVAEEVLTTHMDHVMLPGADAAVLASDVLASMHTEHEIPLVSPACCEACCNEDAAARVRLRWVSKLTENIATAFRDVAPTLQNATCMHVVSEQLGRCGKRAARAGDVNCKDLIALRVNLQSSVSTPGQFLRIWVFPASVQARWITASSQNPGAPPGGTWYRTLADPTARCATHQQTDNALPLLDGCLIGLKPPSTAATDAVVTTPGDAGAQFQDSGNGANVASAMEVLMDASKEESCRRDGWKGKRGAKTAVAPMCAKCGKEMMDNDAGGWPRAHQCSCNTWAARTLKPYELNAKRLVDFNDTEKLDRTYGNPNPCNSTFPWRHCACIHCFDVRVGGLVERKRYGLE